MLTPNSSKSTRQTNLYYIQK